MGEYPILLPPQIAQLPHEILRLPETEQAFLFAAISLKLKHDKEEAQN